MSASIPCFCIGTRGGAPTPLVLKIYVVEVNILARELAAAHELYSFWCRRCSPYVHVMNSADLHTRWLHVIRTQDHDVIDQLPAVYC